MMIFILVKVVLCGCALYHCFVLQRLIKSRFFDEWSLPCAFEDTDAAVDDMESDEFPTELLTSPALHESRLLQLPKNHPSVPLEQELGAIFRGVEQNGCLYGTQACDVDHIIAGISEKQHSNYRTDLSNDRIIVDKHEYDIIDRLGDTISVDTGECYSKDLTNAQQDIHRNAYALLSSVFNRHEGSLSTNATTPMVLHWPINCCVLYRYILATEVINEYSLVQAVVDTIVWRYSFFQPSTAYKMDAVTYVNQIKIPSVVLQEAMRYAEGDEERTLRHGRWSAWMNGTNNVCRMSDEGRMLRSVANKGKDSIGPPVALMYYRNPYPPDTLPLDANAGVSSVSNVNAVNGGDFFDVTPQAQQSLVVYIKHLPPGYEINAVEIKAKDLLHNIHFFHSPNLVSSDIYTESVVCAIERLDSNLRDLQCNDITVVLDVRHMQYSAMPTFLTIKHQINILDNHYPNRLGNLYIVNAGTVSRWLWRMVEPLLSPYTAEKIHFVIGKDMAQLVNQIGVDGIESSYGGMMTPLFDV